MSQTQDLVLYYKPTCPFCARVLDYMEEAHISLPLRNILEDNDALNTLIEVGGKKQVPCLFIDGKPLYESGDIIDYLRENVAEGDTGASEGAAASGSAGDSAGAACTLKF